MAIRFTNPFIEWINGSSEVEAGAKLYFYETGTSTPKDTYSDSDLSIANANPVVADANGKFGDIFLSTGQYKVILKTSADVTVWTADPVGDSLEDLTVTGSVAFSGSTTPSQITADQNNYNPTGLASAVTLRLSTDASRNITGLAGGSSGRIVVIRNVGSFDLVLKDENASSTAANRFALFSDVTLGSDQVAMLQYDATSSRWMIVASPFDPTVTASDLESSALGFNMINGTLTASVGSNALTIAIKTKAGTDPSATDPVLVLFRNATVATGDYTMLTLSAATSVVVSSGSTLGATSAAAFRVWIVGFNDAGTFRLGVVNCRSGTNIYPLGQFPIASSTAEGGAGAADSAQVIYTGTAVTSKAYSVLGYASWETGLTTAGTWDAVPTRLQLHGLGVPLPGQVIQTQVDADSAVATGTTTMPNDDSIPQNTEGDEYLSQAITPTSAANVIDVEARSGLDFNSNAGNHTVSIALFQDTTANALAASGWSRATGLGGTSSLRHRMLAGTTSATTLKIRIGCAQAGTTTFNGASGVRAFGGVCNSYLSVAEVMA